LISVFPCYDLVQHLGLSERRLSEDRDPLRDTARLKPAHKNAALVWARLEAVPSRLKTPT